MKQNKNPSKKSLIRQEKIKAVALKLFLEKGYQNTSLSDIIKLSGGSYSSIYNIYKSKKNLFFAILDDAIKNDYDIVSKHFSKLKITNLEQILSSFANIYLETLYQEQTISIAKILFSEVYNYNEEFAQWIQENRKKFMESILIEIFEKQNTYEILKQNPTKLAEIFCSMIREPHFTLHILSGKTKTDIKEQKEHLEFVIKLFLNAIKN